MTDFRIPTGDESLDDLLGAYALDAVDGPERELVAAHVEANATARRELDELRETASMLALAPLEHEVAPPELFDRIMGAIAPTAATAPVTDLATERARRRGVPWSSIAAVAAVAALVVGLVGVLGGDGDTDGLERLYQATAERGTTMTLAGDGTAHVAMADGIGVIELSELPALSDDEVYQAWAVYPGGGAPISVGVWGDDVDFAEFHYGPELAAIAITVEQGGGVVESTQDPVSVGELP